MTSTAPYAWGITYDHLDHKSGGAAGPRNVDSVLLARLKEAVKAGRKHAADFPDVEWFRMYDDDGELYYTGVRTAILEPWSEDQAAWSTEEGFEPLDDYGTPNAGATEIRYLKPEHASQSASGEVWETL